MFIIRRYLADITPPTCVASRDEFRERACFPPFFFFLTSTYLPKYTLAESVVRGELRGFRKLR